MTKAREMDFIVRVGKQRRLREEDLYFFLLYFVFFFSLVYPETEGLINEEQHRRNTKRKKETFPELSFSVLHFKGANRKVAMSS